MAANRASPTPSGVGVEEESEAALRESRPCSICQSEQRRTVYEWPAGFYPHDVYETASWDGRRMLPLRIVACTDCGFVYTEPSFRVESLGLVYPDDIVPDKIDAEAMLASRKWDAIIAALKTHLSPGATVCDIGARYGVLVKQLRDEGFDSFGVEYNDRAVEQSRRMGVEGMHQGMISDLPRIAEELSLPAVNAVVIDDVLEHLVDPLDDLRTLSGVQQAGDLVVARQMDWDSWGRRFFGKNWYYLAPGAHMGYFNEASATDVFDRAGYSVVSIARSTTASQWLMLIKSTLVRAMLRLRGRAKWQVNGKTMYLSERRRLSDMFLVVARKR